MKNKPRSSGGRSRGDPPGSEGWKNRLAREKSPYLLQHAHNPVDWYPWGDEAFDRARSEDKPLFLSIGYSACHWCHVMEHESFEDPVVAALLNDVFVCVKVDREERPDVDHVYMAACQMITGSGGWPLTILMTPDAKPFFAATYVPKEDRFGRMGLLSLIPRIRDMWAAQRGEIKESAERIALSLVSESAAPAGEALDRGVLEFAYRQLVRRFDETNGGFGTAPKFPAAHNLLFLLRHWKRSGSPEALAMVETTLRSMRRGGIFDHIGFGFHRYSTDAEWRLPHFEKMLYDQAMLSLAYTEAYQATGDPDYRRTAEEILEYVLRDMTAPSGGFYSAEDADSEGEEGKFYVWSLNDLERILDADELGAIREIFELGEGGNFLDEATGQRSGYNLFHMRKAAPGRFGPAGAPENELRDRWEGMRKKLFASREERIHPRKDDKILTDWNGLMIAAFARAARAFGVREYGDAARRSAAFILGHMRTERGGLLHRYRDGEAAIRAAIDDYAFFMWGLIELYETTFDVGYLEAALNLYERFHEDFWDEREGGFFFTSKDGEKLLLRDKELYDAAVPSGNSAALFAMLRLSRMTADTGMEANAGRMSRSFSGLVGRNPAAYTFLLAAVDSLLGPAQEVVIVGGNDERGAQAMIDAVRKVYRPATVVLLKKEKDSVRLGKLAPFTEKLACIAGKATAYVCTNHTCDLPATSVDEMLKMLG